MITYDQIRETMIYYFDSMAFQALTGRQAASTATVTANHEQPTLTPAELQRLVKTPPSQPHEIYFTNHARTTKTIKRTWRERLLTRPWRPFLKYRVEHEPAIFLVHHHASLQLTQCLRPKMKLHRFAPANITIIYAHPTLKDAIETAMKEPAK